MMYENKCYRESIFYKPIYQRRFNAKMLLYLLINFLSAQLIKCSRTYFFISPKKTYKLQKHKKPTCIPIASRLSFISNMLHTYIDLHPACITRIKYSNLVIATCSSSFTSISCTAITFLKLQFIYIKTHLHPNVTSLTRSLAPSQPPQAVLAGPHYSDNSTVCCSAAGRRSRQRRADRRSCLLE